MKCRLENFARVCYVSTVVDVAYLVNVVDDRIVVKHDISFLSII
jgi:hypothetical protein